MKKIKYILLIAIISFFVLPCDSNAVCGTWPDLKLVFDAVDNNGLRREQIYSFYAVIKGNSICTNIDSEYAFDYDESVFEFFNFESKYGYEYSKNKIVLKDKNNENINVLHENDSTIMQYYIDEGTASLVTLFRIDFKVKDNAKLGETNIYHEKVNILCAYDDSNCRNEFENLNDAVHKDNEIKDDNNNQEDKEIGKNILDDPKFYVTTELFVALVIEMFVLILKKTRKI